MELHEMYETLTAKKTELEIDVGANHGLVYIRCQGCHAGHWELNYDCCYRDNVADEMASALIRVKWEDALPDFVHLVKCDGMFYVRHMNDRTVSHEIIWHSGPIEALYHFHMERA